MSADAPGCGRGSASSATFFIRLATTSNVVASANAISAAEPDRRKPLNEDARVKTVAEAAALTACFPLADV